METEENKLKLVKKAMRGNAEAYGHLIEIHREYLYKMAYLYVRNEQDALDVVGNTVLKGFQSIRSLKSPLLFKTWITRITINSAMDLMKKTVPHKEIGELNLPIQEKGVSAEESCDLQWAINQLQDKYRTVIILKYFSEMPLEEIAFTMEIPVGSVKAYLNRAKAELRKQLKEDYRYAN